MTRTTFKTESPLAGCSSGLKFGLLLLTEYKFFSFFILVPTDVPKCKKPDLTIIGASIEELLHVLCQVDADPNRVKFSWQFNNSAGESLKVSSDVYRTVNKTNSELTYKPLSDLDYGTLICWADNTIGRQFEPCVFHLVPAGKYFIIGEPKLISSLHLLVERGNSLGEFISEESLRCDAKSISRVKNDVLLIQTLVNQYNIIRLSWLLGVL